MNKSKSNLANELEHLLNPEPILNDSDDELGFDGLASSLYKSTNEQNVDVLPVSSMRKKQVQSLSSFDKKYLGKKVDRQTLEQSDEEELEQEDEEGDSFDEDDGGSQNEEFDEEEEEDNQDQDDDVNEESDVPDQEPEDVNQANFLNIDNEKQISKAKAVKNQLLIYDNLLEARIKFQRLLNSINRLPQKEHSTLVHKSDNVLLNETMKNSKSVMKKLYKTLLEIDSHLELKSEAGEKRKALDLPSGDHPKRFCSLRDHYPSILDSWFDQTKFIHANLKNFSSFEVNPTKSINNILANKERLVNRTKVKRSDYSIIGQTEEEVQSFKEIYDDDDFYHILLKDIVDNNSDNLQDPMATSRKYIEIQRLRNRIKKKVDTRASKGRKIRYDVQEKLVNFMAPIDRTSMSDDARNELFKSLFGGASNGN